MNKKWNSHVFVILTLLVTFSLLHEFVSSTRVRSGSVSMPPGHVSKITIGANEGDQVTLNYEADFRPIEFALIRLNGLDRDDFANDIDLNLVSCLHHEVAQSAEVYFEIHEDSDYLLFIRNIANITQQFRYEWVAVNPDEEMAAAVTMLLAPLVTFGFCIFCGILCKMRHEHLLRQEQPTELAWNSGEIPLKIPM